MEKLSITSNDKRRKGSEMNVNLCFILFHLFVWFEDCMIVLKVFLPKEKDTNEKLKRNNNNYGYMNRTISN